MKTQLQYIRTAFKVEWLKIKGFGLLYTILITAALYPLLILGLAVFVEDFRSSYDGVSVSIFSHNIVEGYGMLIFLLILLVIITTSRITQSDHRNNGWIFMETQPLSKLSIYAGKFLAALQLITFFLFLFYIFTIISSLLIQLIFPNEAFTLSLEWGFLVHSFLRLWLLSLGIISIQLMLAMTFSGFIWPIILGILGLGLNLIGAIKQTAYDFSPYSNLQIGGSFKNLETLNHYFNYTEYLSLFWAAVYFLIGYSIYKNKGIKNTFIGSKKRIAGSLIGLLCIIGGYWLLTQPIYTEKNAERTIISGTVSASQKVKHLTIYENELGSEITKIPVKNGKFKWETTDKIPFQSYKIKIRKKTICDTYLATGDDIQLNIKMRKNALECITKGTRAASSKYSGNTSWRYFDYVARNKTKFVDKPKRFYKYAEEEWKDVKARLNSFRTYQNIHLENDAKAYILQVNALKMLNLLYDYQKITSFEDEKYAIPENLEKNLLQTIKKPNAYIYANNEYKSWKIKQFLPKKEVANPDSIIISKLQEMPQSNEKDQLLAYEMVKLLKLQETTEERTAFFNANIAQFKNKNYKNFVTKQLDIINQLQKGSPFPHFKVLDEQGKTIDLVEKFKGKYIVIDWWATWCAPCKRTKPKFAYKAKKYVSDKVVFVAISIDRNPKDWQLAIKDDKSKVQNFWLTDANIMEKLGINGIPHFMLIDKEGKMYNSDLARPDDANFTEVMKTISKS